jgi:hypothetical protein
MSFSQHWSVSIIEIRNLIHGQIRNQLRGLDVNVEF